MKQQTQRYDIIIVGGGMVGASLACALRQTDLRIALIDATPLDAHDDHRLIGLTHPSHEFLQTLGVWQSLAAFAEPIKQIHVSDQGRFGALRLRAADVELATLGFTVPAKYINAALNDIISANKNIDVIRPAQLKTLIQDDAHVTVSIHVGEKELALTGTLLIGADGSHSTVREQLNISAEVTAYPLSALVTITSLQRAHKNIAYERFHATGAIAMLPLTQQRAATIWTDTHSNIAILMQMDDATFLQQLQQQFGYRLGRLIQTHRRYVYPLQMIKAQQTIVKNCMLIGNAAHTLSPLAAQGLNFALSEIAVLSQTLIEQQTHLANLHWQKYLAWQQSQQTISTRLSHQLPHLFSSDFLPIKLARQLGLMGLDICVPAKRYFIRQALGNTCKTNPFPFTMYNTEL